MSQRLVIPSYCNRITQKVKNAQRIFYISVHDNEKSAETFLRQYVRPLMKSPADALPQDTQQEPSAAKGEDT